MNKIFGLVILLALAGCRTSTDRTASEQAVAFLDAAAGRQYLMEGDVDGYYDLMSPAHMSVQAKDTTTYASIADQRKAYRAKMKDQVKDWSEQEIQQMTALMDTAKLLVHQLNPDLWPSQIKMIKVDSEHYGESVYYTLGDAIVWPDNIFDDFTIDGQLTVALHEVWHLISRDYPALKDSVYTEIGFVRHGYDIELGPILTSRLLVNPDGVAMDHAIVLSSDSHDTTVMALPVLASRFDKYRPSMTAFFDYLHFDLHELKVRDNSAVVESAADGTSLMDPSFFPSFFTQIGDNTQYIIHPDEISADNFVLAIKSVDDTKMPPLSPEGKVLLDRIAAHLVAFDN